MSWNGAFWEMVKVPLSPACRLLTLFMVAGAALTTAPKAERRAMAETERIVDAELYSVRCKRGLRKEGLRRCCEDLADWS